MSTVVDIHCHTFNGDDLPVRGFVRGVHLEDGPMGDAIATLVDRMVQAKAPGYEEEIRRLDTLLSPTATKTATLADGADESIDAGPALVGGEMVPDLETRVREDLRELTASDPYLLKAAEAEMKAAAGDTLIDSEGVGDWGPAAVRVVRWAALYASSRLENTVHLVRQFGDEVDLFTPMLVDLELGLNDRAKTTVMQQIEMQERISRLSMLRRLPGVRRARIHPFVGFDPRREILSAQRGDPFGALDIVKLAVKRYGFVGVKLYPPMGFRPLNNASKAGGPPGQDGEQVDNALRRLYQWCLDEDVPITAHCNISNGALDAYNAFSDPDDWRTVLEGYPGLHLNLGHFGGMRKLTAGAWPRKIAALASENDGTPGRHLYADVGNHRTDKSEFGPFIADLGELFKTEETKVMANRLMYGSDWYMLAILPNLNDFVTHYTTAYRQKFGEPAVHDFLGARALSFLGFDDPKNKNRQRLRDRYDRYAPDSMPKWLTDQPT